MVIDAIDGFPNVSPYLRFGSYLEQTDVLSSRVRINHGSRRVITWSALNTITIIHRHGLHKAWQYCSQVAV